MDSRVALVLLTFVLTACGGATDTTTGGGKDGGAGTPGTGGSTGACNPTCGQSRDCCTDHCVNLQNDPLNCGKCGKKCDNGTYCTSGQCTAVPCETTCGAGSTCCGGACCKSGEICCDPQGPIERGPACQTPTNGTCAMGCAPLCICASPDTPI